MERPVTLKAHEVRGILDGRQTQLRRVVKLDSFSKSEYFGYDFAFRERSCWHDYQLPDLITKKCPFGQVGDRLWGREAFITGHPLEPCTQKLLTYDEGGNYMPEKVWYRAEDDLSEWLGEDGYVSENIPWKSSTQMPRWASRILLEIVSVRVLRLKDMSEADALAEGIQKETKDGHLWKYGLDGWSWKDWWLTAVGAFGYLWASINGQASWESNPWVWVVEVKRVDAQ
ncbi:hypothetical protein J2766_001062 [Agrobacterium tumefaciens]|uniref:Morphogenetic protein n=1 Tax=Agrobacterium tumefaciens TaxID=358 RepID=A0AAW8LSA8_AGRTU|nr:hypothetical protein [Agrobacterium tumefaciens]MBP2564503.1 hypothetical protein [Agrobacterium tumefaciens]MDR6701632.1 hypothetical protein [Agrobacterium tumefaciens]